MIAPATPAFFRRRTSSTVVTPPDAITGNGLAFASAAVASMSLRKDSFPNETCVKITGRDVSSPGTPEAASQAFSFVFSSSVCGA
jgi:hypothetical protein